MWRNPRAVVILLAFAVLAAVPPVAAWLDESFYVILCARIMIFAIAAMSLDLILGYGGMVSLGHAAYLGIGGYAVAVLSFYGIDDGLVQFPVAIVGSAGVALVIGAVCLRTSGVYFIMITLAFTQMLYYLGISIEEYGGDDGITTYRSEFFGSAVFNDNVALYYFIFACLVVIFGVLWRITNSRFGMVIRGSHSNDRRMHAIGFHTFRFRLIAFVIAGAVCGVAGALLANLSEFMTPEVMNWKRSGEILIMVLMGGIGTLFGPILGAAAFILLENFLEDITQHWMLFFGPFLVLLVLFAKRGLYGLIPGPGASRE